MKIENLDQQIDAHGRNSSAGMAERQKARYPWVDIPATEISIRVRQAASSVTGAFARCLATVGMKSRSRYAVLRNIYYADGQRETQGDLSRDLDVTSATITYLIDCLEKDGLVNRCPHPADRRFTFVELTREGAAFCDAVTPVTSRFPAHLCDEFSPEEMDLLNRLLDKLRDRAESLYR